MSGSGSRRARVRSTDARRHRVDEAGEDGRVVNRASKARAIELERGNGCEPGDREPERSSEDDAACSVRDPEGPAPGQAVARLSRGCSPPPEAESPRRALRSGLRTGTHGELSPSGRKSGAILAPAKPPSASPASEITCAVRPRWRPSTAETTTQAQDERIDPRHDAYSRGPSISGPPKYPRQAEASSCAARLTALMMPL